MIRDRSKVPKGFFANIALIAVASGYTEHIHAVDKIDAMALAQDDSEIGDMISTRTATAH